MLDKISMFAKNNSITIQQFNYKFSPRFPSAFYETVVEFMKLARAKYDPSDKMESFNIKFDRENNAYFEFNEPNGHARVIVIPDFTKFDNLPPAKVVRESTFFKTLFYLDENINKKIINSKLITVVTDYKSHDVWLNDIKNTDIIVVSHNDEKKRILKSTL